MSPGGTDLGHFLNGPVEHFPLVVRGIALVLELLPQLLKRLTRLLGFMAKTSRFVLPTTRILFKGLTLFAALLEFGFRVIQLAIEEFKSFG
jgi:hypothetical protein